MSTFCFTERPRALFAEATARGWLAAVRDFPRLQSWQACVAAAQGIPGELRAEVCCIGEDDYPYRVLVVTAWVNSYQAFARDASERQIVLMVAALKATPPGEALALIRHGFSDGDAQAAINEGYERFRSDQARPSRS